MQNDFDPYFNWLGIPPSEQPPNHYRLLGLPPFVDDLDTIEHAVDQRMGHIRTFQSGKHSQASQRILNELSSARVTLLNTDSKEQYDARLRAESNGRMNAKPLLARANPFREDPVRESVVSSDLTTAQVDGKALQSTTNGLAAQHESTDEGMRPPLASAALNQSGSWILRTAIAGGVAVSLVVLVFTFFTWRPNAEANSLNAVTDSDVTTEDGKATTSIQTDDDKNSKSKPLDLSRLPNDAPSDQIGLVGRVSLDGQVFSDVLLIYQSSGILPQDRIARLFFDRDITFTAQSLSLKFQGVLDCDEERPISIRLIRGKSRNPGESVVLLDGKAVASFENQQSHEVTHDQILSRGEHQLVWEIEGGLSDCMLEIRDDQGNLVPLMHSHEMLFECGAGSSEVVMLGQRSDPEIKKRAVDWALSVGGRPVVTCFVDGRKRDKSVNQLSELPQDYYEVTSINFINASLSAAIDDEGIANLAGLKHLQRIYLRDSKITDRSLELCSQFHRMRDLMLVDNQGITDEGMKSLATLSDLQTLSLSRTNITKRGIENLLPIQSLRRLYLAETQTGSAELEQIARFEELQDLNFDGVQSLSADGLAHLAALPELSTLSLAESNVTDRELVAVGGIKSLKHVILNNTAVTNQSLDALCGLQQLTRLDLKFVEGITNEGLGVLATIKSLHSINLDGCQQITDEGIARLKELDSLNYVDATNTGITKTGIADLKTSNPKVRVRLNGVTQ